jgi:predicted kinase
MPQLSLIIGPVGAGKSTFARQLSQQQSAIRLTLDEWMAQLYGPDERPAVGRIEWYIERTKRCLEQIWRLTSRAHEVGANIILEIGLIQRSEREAFYKRVSDAGWAMTVYVLDAPRELRRERVMKRNAVRGDTFSMEVPMPFFEIASDRWEPPTQTEREACGFPFVEVGA